VPEYLVLEDKDGTKHDGNGRELYAAGHRRGYRICWTEHQQGHVDLTESGLLNGTSHRIT